MAWRRVSRRELLVGIACSSISVACGRPARPAASVRIDPARLTLTPTPAADQGKIIFLDPGHGGKDWGAKAQTPDGTWLAEKTYTLDIALRTAPLLRSAGYRVVLSRTTDPPANQWPVNNPPRDLNGDGAIDAIDDVQARINIANAAGADLLLSIHLNAGPSLPDGGPNLTFGGVATLYDPDRSFSAQNKRFAGLVQAAMMAVMTRALGAAPRNWGAADDTTLPTPFTTSRHTYHHDVELGPSSPGWITASRMPGVISEPLFLTNPAEQKVLLETAVRDQIASGYVKAIQAYFGGAQQIGG